MQARLYRRSWHGKRERGCRGVVHPQVGIARAEPSEPCIDGKEQRADAVSAQRLWQAAEQVEEAASPERADEDVGQTHLAERNRVRSPLSPAEAPQPVVSAQLPTDGEPQDPHTPDA